MATAATGAVLGSVLGAVTKNVVDLLVKLGQKRFQQWKGLQADIQSIKSELVMIVAEEEDHLSREGHMSTVKSEFMEVMRDLAHDIEDFLDRISRFTESDREASTFQRIKAVGSRAGGHPFAAEVKQLKKRLKDAHQFRVSYKVNDGESSATAKPAAVASSRYAANTAVAQPVGIDKPKEKVLKLLHDHNIEGRRPDNLKVISIVGFGGSGKSTLAKAVYDSPDVRRRFTCWAWVVASKHGGDTKGLLTALFVKLRPGERANEDIEQLQAEISNYLNNERYLIVLDDIKELQCWEWDSIKAALPEKTTSRIIVTTTIQTVARVCSRGNGYVHDMSALEGKDSKELLKVVLNGHLPGLEESAKPIVDKCDGHPLALVAVANYLLTSEYANAERDCEELCRNLGFRMAKENAFQELREVLINSYSRLPNDYRKQRHLRNLKTCLLYLCVFPNGSHIRGSRLMRRWFAEKYVQDEYPLSELEVANEYLKKLVDPNIIQPIGSTKHEEVKTWRAHGIMHEFMLHMSKDAKFITSHANKDRSNYRHLFIQNTSSGKVSSKAKCHGTSRARCSTSVNEKFRAHSLTICGSAAEVFGDFPKCELLRVLDLEECNDLKDEHLNGIHELWFLRYLSLGGTISRVPRDIEKLHWLETLDMRKTKREIELPVKVIKLPHLAHLLGRFKLDKRKWEKSKAEKYVAEESNLQTVAGFVTDNNAGFPKLMTHMDKLTKVKIWCDSADEALLEAIKKFIQVGIDTSVGDRSLTLYLLNSSGNILTSLEKSLENSYAYLSSLKLHGALSGLTQFEFTTLLLGLRELCLSSTNDLTINELSNLKKLKYLKYLKLVKISLGDFVIKKGNFPGLMRLCIVESPCLPTIQDGALQRLISFHILNQDLDGLSGIKMERHTLLQEIALDSDINPQTKTQWENAATNHPKRPRVLYLKRISQDQTGSTVKYIATNRPASETESETIQEERQIPTIQSVSVQESSSAALENVNPAGPSVTLTELSNERNDDLTTLSSRASLLVEVNGLQSSSLKEMKVHQEEKNEANPAAEENIGEVSSNYPNHNSSGSDASPKGGMCPQRGDDHGKMNESSHHHTAHEDDGAGKNCMRYNFSEGPKAMPGVVIKETAVNGSKTAMKNTVTTAVDISCGEGKGKMDEIPENAIHVANDRELALKLQKFEEHAIEEGVTAHSTW